MEYGKCARKAGNTILAALAVVVISVGPVAAQERHTWLHHQRTAHGVSNGLSAVRAVHFD